MVLPLDMPDDYIWLPGSGRSTLGDLGELAARLGSPVTYDRRGSVYWFDQVDHGISPWSFSLGGTGAGAEATAQYSLRGGYSIKAIAGSSGAHRVVISRYVNPALLTTYGLEAVFSLHTDATSVEVLFDYYDDASQHAAYVMVDYANQQIKYLNSAGSYVVIDTINITNTLPALFNVVKLVVDTIDHKYVRVLFNQNEYDLSGIAYRNIAIASTPRIGVGFILNGANGVNAIGYFDSMILTVGDP